MGGPKRIRDADAETVQQDPQPTKKRRVFSEQDKRLAKIYEDLADDVGDVRIQAAKALLAETSPQASDDDAADARKITLRLIKGLCSSRKAARLGYFVALTELLRQTVRSPASASDPPSLHLDEVVQLAVKSTEPEGGASGQEKRDHLLGRVAACNAILLSRILAEPVLATTQLSEVLDLISSLARAKAWLREECGNVIYRYAQGLDKPRAKAAANLIFESLSKHDLLKTPEGVAIWVALQPKVKSKALPRNVWKGDDPLSTRNWHSLAVVLRTGSPDGSDDVKPDSKRQKGGASQPEPSFAWMATVSAFVASQASEQDVSDKEQLKNFEDFWRELVDNNLFSQSASQEKKGWGFTIVASAVSTLPIWALPALFSPNLTKTLINQRADVNRYLHAAALIPLNAVRRRAVQDPGSGAALLKVLLKLPDVMNFDQATKSKTLEGIIAAPHAHDALNSIASLLVESLAVVKIFKVAEQDFRHRKGRFTALLDLFVLLFRRQAGLLDDRGDVSHDIGMALYLLAELSYHPTNTLRMSEDPNLAEFIRLARTRLQACLSAILASDSRTGSIYAEYIVINLFGHFLKDQGTSFELDASVRKRLQKSFRQFQTTKFSDSTVQAIKLLHSLTLLEVLNGEADALAMLDDIDPLYRSMSSDTSTDRDQSAVLTEIILSFVSKPSTLFRRLAETVFAAIAPQLSASALQALVDVLQKPESLSGQQELFEPRIEAEAEETGSDIDNESDSNDDEENDDGDDDGDPNSDDDSDEVPSDDDVDISMDSDVEVVDSTSSPHGAEVNGDGTDSESEAASEDDEDEQELLKLDAVLAETLGTNRLDDDEDSDADMDDEQMMALEPALTKIFQERRKAETSNKKQDRKDAKENMVNFKNRVLDLLQIYLKQAHASRDALDLILPLLKLMHTTSTRQLGEKAFNVLKVYFDSSKGKPLPTVKDPQPLINVLIEVHRAAERNEAKMYSTACSRSSLFLARVLLAADPELFGQIEDVYSDTMKQRRKKGKKSKVQRNFFLDWTNYAYDLAR